MALEDDVLAKHTIPQNEAGVNSELSTGEAQSTSNPDATDGLGAADAGFAGFWFFYPYSFLTVRKDDDILLE